MEEREGPFRKFLKGSGPIRDTLRGRSIIGQELGTPITGDLNRFLEAVGRVERMLEDVEDRVRAGSTVDFQNASVLLSNIETDVGIMRREVDDLLRKLGALK